MNIDSEILLQTYDLLDMINNSDELMTYFKYKGLVDEDEELKNLRKELRKANELYEETQRFGHFHPNYDDAKERIDKILIEINKNPNYNHYKKAEDELNDLFYLISNTLASSISTSIKVPKYNDLITGDSCSTGNCSSCGIKGSCSI